LRSASTMAPASFPRVDVIFIAITGPRTSWLRGAAICRTRLCHLRSCDSPLYSLRATSPRHALPDNTDRRDLHHRPRQDGVAPEPDGRSPEPAEPHTCSSDHTARASLAKNRTPPHRSIANLHCSRFKQPRVQENMSLAARGHSARSAIGPSPTAFRQTPSALAWPIRPGPFPTKTVATCISLRLGGLPLGLASDR
jgi:hypothetical protein